MSAMAFRDDNADDAKSGRGPSDPPDQSPMARIVGMRLQQDYSERLSAISHFSMEIAHHLNNSLTPILCYAQLLSQGSCSQEQKKRLQRITEAAHHAKEIVDGLIAFAGGQPTQILPVDLNALARETIEVAEGLLWLPQRQVHFDPFPGLPPILGDPHQLSQVLLHLLRNSMQATSPETRRIVVRIQRAEASRVILEVEDNGCGIPAEILPKVLLPFFTTREGEGVGLGLSIVNGIAEAHSARLEIHTEVGEGTRVSISFPQMEI